MVKFVLLLFSSLLLSAGARGVCRHPRPAPRKIIRLVPYRAPMIPKACKKNETKNCIKGKEKESEE